MKTYRLALDLGTNSIGWLAYELIQDAEGEWTPMGVLDAGVRIFRDGRHPKDGSSNAIARRQARAMRRNRDRFIQRRQELLEALTRFGLMPTAEKDCIALCALDPYDLRKRGLDEALTPHELGRAIFHLNQRRGFKSNRKTDSKENDTGLIKTAIEQQTDAMQNEGARTFGEFLYLRREQGHDLRARLRTRDQEQQLAQVDGKKAPKNYYDIYPSRSLIELEFNALWRKQQEFHPDLLTHEAREAIDHAIFYQRPLKPPIVGRCTFERDEVRAPQAMPVVQQSRIYQELNHLQLIDKTTLESYPLSLDQRDTLALKLCKPAGKKSRGKVGLKFDKMRAILGLEDHITFSLEQDPKREGLDCDAVAELMCHKERFGPKWYELSMDDQTAVILQLQEEEDEEALIQDLMVKHGLSRIQATSAAKTHLPTGHSRLGATANGKILEQLKTDVLAYSEAVIRAGYKSHSDFSVDKRHDRLPYYAVVLERHVVPNNQWHGHPAAPLEKRYGKITNPTVHIVMNQLRKLVNELIKLYGPPTQIHLEVLRDLKNSLKKKKEIMEVQKRNKDLNDQCAAELRQAGQRVNRENIQRLRLWHELPADRRACVYSGEAISHGMALSDQVEIDHILPFSKTLDDSMANKVLCIRSANRDKANRSPFETWGNKPHWNDIVARSVAILPDNKQWRFSEDAMERFVGDHESFLARQMTDSQYIARLARTYLAILFEPNEGHKVVCLPGRLTGMFRKALGLETVLDEVNPWRKDAPGTPGEKNRNDYRNHTLDAAVVGLMDRSFLQRAARLSARQDDKGISRLFEDFVEPWPGFRKDLREGLNEVVVSYKTDHGIEGALHNDMPYGILETPTHRGNAVKRAMAESIGLSDIIKIKGKHLRAQLYSRLAQIGFREAFDELEELEENRKKATATIKKRVKYADKEIPNLVKEFFDEMNIRRVKLVDTVNLVVPKKQAPTKGFRPDGNAYLEIYELPESRKWQWHITTTFEANARAAGLPFEPNPLEAQGAKKIIRLFNLDMLELEHQGKRGVYYIQRMSDGFVSLAPHFEANADRRTRSKEDPFSFVYKGSGEILKSSRVRFLVVSPAGQVRYLSDDLSHDAAGTGD